MALAALRWQERSERELSDQARLRRELAGEVRRIIDSLVSTTATAADVERSRAALAEVSRAMQDWGTRRSYEGFAEAANAGDDPLATFEHSPFLGLANPLSPPLRVRFEPDRVIGTVTFGVAYEGPPGCVHGGYVAAAFDEILGGAQCLSGTAGMTANLSVDYRRPTPLETELTLVGQLESVDGRKIRVSGSCSADGEVTAEARGLFISMRPEMMDNLRRSRGE